MKAHVTVKLTADEALALYKQGKMPDVMNGYELVCAMHGREKIRKALGGNQ